MGENASWGIKAELAFIAGLGEHSEHGRISGLPYDMWLQKYISSHKKSTYAHHLAGVSYAKKLLGKTNKKSPPF